MAHNKRAKHSIDHTVTIDGLDLEWHLISEPMWLVGRGVRGVRISVQVVGGGTRELILEYPFPSQRPGTAAARRPQVDPRLVEEGIRRALVDGWDPGSRGKLYTFYIEETASG